MYFTRLFIIMVVIALSLVGCSNEHPDQRLVEIHKISFDDQDKADSMLNNIDKQHLDTFNRHYYDMLRIKIDDKMFKDLDADSLIVTLINNLTHTSDELIQFESLYLRGRLFHELGDYPQANLYYEKALSKLPYNRIYDKQRASLLGQMAHLMNRLRLHDEALHYIRRAIEIDREICDSDGLFIDYNLLSELLIRANKDDSAKVVITKLLAMNVDDRYHLKQEGRVNLAKIYCKRGYIDSALATVRKVDLTCDPIMLNYALTTAAKIYKDANITDTAYLYAKMAMDNKYKNNKTVAYSLILSPELQKFVPTDSLRRYVSTYSNMLDSFYNQNNAQAVMIQKGIYNYDWNLAEKEKTERKNGILIIIILVSVCIILATVCLTVSLKLRNRNILVRLQKAIMDTDIYKDQLLSAQKELKEIKSSPETNSSADESDLQEDECLKSRTLIAENNARMRIKYRQTYLNTEIPDNVIADEIRSLTNSDVFKRLNKYDSHNNIIPDNDPLWDDMRQEICIHFKGFFEMLAYIIHTPVA